MKIQLPILAFTLVTAMAAASAQSYKWIDKDGKVRYGDTQPVGAKVTAVKPLPGVAPPPAAGKEAAKNDARDAKKGPLTPVEQEQAFRKRKLDEEEARKKEEQTLAAEQGRRQNCEKAQESVRQLESGQRISRTDAKGESYYLEDDQRAKEIAAARKTAADWCSK